MYTKTLVTTWNQFEQLREGIERNKIFAYDTETNGTFDRFEVSLVGLSFAFDDRSAFYIPVAHDEGNQLNIVEVLDELQPYLESEQYEKICHHEKFDEMVLSRHGIDVQGTGHDTIVMAWLLSEDRSSLGLKSLISDIFQFEMETYEDVVSSAPKKRGVPRDYNFARVSISSALSYAADDAYWTLKLFNYYRERLEKENLWDAYDRVERPFVRVLRNIEAAGVHIDREALQEADKRLPEIIQQVETEIYEEAGEVFNIDSGPQLGPILFDKLGIGENVPTTKTGRYKTDNKTLAVYSNKHKVVENVLRHKKIRKTHSVFVEGLGNFVAKDGRIHPSFNGQGTVTGRLSCRSPNLQQIEGDEVEEIRIRNFFIPTPGYRFVVSDYGQIELRVMAHLAKDQAAIDAFNSGRDFHEETARGMFKIPESEPVIHRQRFTAKSLNFGIPYGRGAQAVAELLDILDRCQYWPHFDKKLMKQGIKKWYPLGEKREEMCGDCAACYIEKWWEGFPEVRKLKEHNLEKGRHYGYIRTLAGRKRRLPDLTSSNKMLKARAERQAFNSLIQGSAADIIKIAMIALEQPLADLGARMIIQIHDELVIEAPEDIAQEVLETTQRVMEAPVNGKNPLILPLIADPKIVDRWGDAK